MRFVALLVLVFGVALAGGAIFFASEYFREYEASLASRNQGPVTVKVIAAKAPLNYGDQIAHKGSGETLRWVQWPKEAVPEGAFTSLEDLLGEDFTQDRTVLRRIEPGELILKTKVTGFGESARVATQVSDGKRAFTIPINAVSGVAGFVAPGDRVDILLTRSIERQMTTSIILQNILVIATDQRANTETSSARVARTATVEVDPTDAQKLALAQQVGKLSLTLRGVNEAVNTDVQPVGLDDLPDQPERIEPEPEPVVRQNTVRVRKGTDVQDVAVD